MAMEEDYLGPREMILRDRYTTCNICGRTVLRSRAKLMPARPLSGVRSEFQYVCLDCKKKLESGELVPELTGEE